MSENRQTRKPIRLERSAYRELGSAWLLTIATYDRQPYFSDHVFAGALAAVLIEVAETRGLSLDLYCFMPDHLHVIAQVTTGDIVSAIQAFKSLGARLWLDWGGFGPLWQRSFYDNGLRTARAFDEAVAYVFNNPTMAGLADSWEEYPLIGGNLAGRL